MTRIKKALAWLIFWALLLGGAFAGGFYTDMLKRRAVEKQLDEANKRAAEAEAASVKTIAGSRARTQLLEATLGVLHHTYGMALDRVDRAKALVSSLNLGPSVDKELEEVRASLIAQRPEVVAKLLSLADKIEPAPVLSLPKLPSPTEPPRPNAASSVPAAATPAPAAAGLVAKEGRDADAERDFQEGRDALRQAKALLLVGGEAEEIVKKLARAQVLLDDSGYTELDDDLGTAIKAAKSHDEARARSALEASLARLRAR